MDHICFLQAQSMEAGPGPDGGAQGQGPALPDEGDCHGGLVDLGILEGLEPCSNLVIVGPWKSADAAAREVHVEGCGRVLAALLLRLGEDAERVEAVPVGVFRPYNSEYCQAWALGTQEMADTVEQEAANYHDAHLLGPCRHFSRVVVRSWARGLFTCVQQQGTESLKLSTCVDFTRSSTEVLPASLAGKCVKLFEGEAMDEGPQPCLLALTSGQLPHGQA